MTYSDTRSVLGAGDKNLHERQIYTLHIQVLVWAAAVYKQYYVRTINDITSGGAARIICVTVRHRIKSSRRRHQLVTTLKLQECQPI